MESLFQSLHENERHVAEDYLSSLRDLNCNSKPLINMLTMLAEENINFAHVIVRVVEFHISQVPPEFKLPILYLIDSIIKNVKSNYVQLFGQCIVNIFLNAFESVQHSQSQVLEKVRERMYALRQTWNEVFPPSKMYALDVKVKRLDNNWPITAKQPTKIHVNPAIHVNPDFLKTGMVPMPVASTLPSDMEEILQAKTRELLELKKRKLELELEQTKKHLEEQERQLSLTNEGGIAPAGLPVVPAAALRPPGVPMEAPLRPPVAGPSGLFNQAAIRPVRPVMPAAAPIMPGMPAQQPVFTPMQQLPQAAKPKVHPVNAALLNTMRQRDPRLARQMQQTPAAPMPPQTGSVRGDPRLENKASSSSQNSHISSSRSRSKSPQRSGGSSRSGKSGNSSSSSSSNRKRSESKSSTASSSSSGSERRKGSSSTQSNNSKRSSSSRDKHVSSSSSGRSDKDHDRYARNGSPSSKRKSNSPISSPAKSKRSSNHKSRSGKSSSSGTTRSRSSSPQHIDLDLRGKSPDQVSTSGAGIANDLEKPHLSTAMMLPTSSSAASAAGVAIREKSSVLPGNVSSVPDALKQSLDKLMSTTSSITGEKRTAAVIAGEPLEDELQPQQKRSKSAKLDALFGSEDVDLRRELPAVKPASIATIVVEDDSMENWDNPKSQNQSKLLSPKKPTLEELRDKLAKTVRNNNKLAKNEKLAQRLKQLAELRVNEDSQEAQDDHVRIILGQAKELFESREMSAEQYRDLVEKMVTVNDNNNKLNQAKRRMAMAALADAAVQEDKAVPPEQRERNAARDAVLKKRIPKLKSNENHLRNESSPRSDGSPLYEEVEKASTAVPQKPKPTNKREGKRRKPSKWGEQVQDPHLLNQRGGNWMDNKRAAGGFRGNSGGGNGPAMASNMRMPVTGPWQQPFSGVPPMLVAASAPMVAEVAAGAVPPPPQPPSMHALPPVPPITALTKAINSLDNPMADMVRSITIDGGSKEIRLYNQVAIIFMDADEPREIGFQNGQRAIFIDSNEPLVLNFNDDYKPFTLDGQLHRIRFGFPSHELYIDDHWYEIYFGGPPISLPIGNKMHVLKAEGPAPNLDIGRVRRDLVVGKINMIVDAHHIVPLFLDGMVQKFQLGAEQHQLQFVDAFSWVMLDGKMMKVDYGGLPKSANLNGRNSFIRFGTLPKGVQAGKTHVRDMLYIKTEAPAEAPQPPPIEPVIPPVQAPAVEPSSILPTAAAALSNLNIDELFKKLVSSGIIGGGAAPVVAPNTSTPAATQNSASGSSSNTGQETATPAPAEAPVASGPPPEPIKRIELNKPETIKTRQAAVVASLYSGMQCSSCGVRFPPEQTIKYSQHLDWHFRQNRRERDSTRKATSRKWFYSLSDWMQYEEIEDVEEREKNFLEAQQNGPDALDELSNQRSMDSPMPSCAAGTDDVDRACDMCQEKFEQFYNEELEEWHLRGAIRVEDKIYHPLCYEDYKASLNPPAKEDKSESKDVTLESTDDNAMDTIIKIECSEIELDKDSSRMDDDDDDVIVLPNEEPSVTEIVDDDEDEYVPVQIISEEKDDKAAEEPSAAQRQNSHNESATESDVEIQEPNIPFTDLDTYVEKELPDMDEAAQAAFLNIKIKEEPKDDEEDEDDGFEDVGTVVLQPPPVDEISINSSETQTQTIASSASPITLDRPPSVASLTAGPVMTNNEDEFDLVQPTEANNSANNNQDNAANSLGNDSSAESQENAHNLSAAGPAPALPLASIVNKIKININKNNTNSHSNSNAAAAATAATTTSATGGAAAEDNQVSAISVIGGGGAGGGATTENSNSLGQVNVIQTISTIPVLCGGNTFVPKITSSSVSSSSSSSSTNHPPANISSISVIGSSYGGTAATSASSNSARYTKSSSSSATTTTSSSAAASVSAAPAQSPPPAAVIAEAEPEPVIEFKPALRNVTLKKTKKVKNGIETSGLCSIM